MNDIKTILSELGINHEVTKSKDGTYILDIEDMDEFGKYYSLLDRNDNVEELDETSLMTIHNISLNYLYKNYQFSLISDNDQDSYKLVITLLSKEQIAEIEAESDEDEEDSETNNEDNEKDNTEDEGNE